MIPAPFRTAIAIAMILLLRSFLAMAQGEEGESGADEILDTQTAVVDLSNLSDIDGLIDKLEAVRVVFVGESHDRYEDHLNQLAIVRGLHEKGKDLAIGMEFFQQPFQKHVDAYIAGEISEKEMLRRTEYFERWRYDYRLYRPILRYAREHGIAVIALNLEREITEKVGEGGIEALSEAQRARIPAQMDRDDPDYRERLRVAFEHHPEEAGRSFDRFFEVQLLWDEGMAERAARYLEEHPERSMVILAGSGHLEYRQGIPRRLERRAPVASAVVLSGAVRDLEPGVADYLLYPWRVELPAAGLLGVMLDMDSDGQGVAVQGFYGESGAKDAGIEEGDRIVRVGDEPIDSYADIRIALIGARPGQKMPVEVVREHLIGSDELLTLEVQLH